MPAVTCPVLDASARLCDSLLQTVLPAADCDPQRLHEAMRYAVFAGGKRIRPALVLTACRAAGGADAPAHPAMAAIELLHTYTLVHDDLPAMDDDDLRRGRPTVHRAYDEATAILVGDALQALAFGELARLGADAVACLARAAGSLGVVGGQQRDLDATGGTVDAAAAELVERIHRDKTAALIAAACELGAIAAEAEEPLRNALATYGRHMGLAFQIVDDLLDASGSSDELGKTPGKDAAQAKLTTLSVHGVDSARTMLQDHRRRAESAIAHLGDGAEDLRQLGRFIIERSY